MRYTTALLLPQTSSVISFLVYVYNRKMLACFPFFSKPLERPLFRDRRLARRRRAGCRPRLFLSSATGAAGGPPRSGAGPPFSALFSSRGASVPRGGVDGVGPAAGGQRSVCCRRRRGGASSCSCCSRRRRRCSAPARTRPRRCLRLRPRRRGARPRARVHARHQPRPRRERPVVLQQQPPRLLVQRRLRERLHEKAPDDDEDVPEAQVGLPVLFEDVDADIAGVGDVWVEDLGGELGGWGAGGEVGG